MNRYSDSRGVDRYSELDGGPSPRGGPQIRPAGAAAPAEGPFSAPQAKKKNGPERAFSLKNHAETVKVAACQPATCIAFPTVVLGAPSLVGPTSSASCWCCCLGCCCRRGSSTTAVPLARSTARQPLARACAMRTQSGHGALAVFARRVLHGSADARRGAAAYGNGCQ